VDKSCNAWLELEQELAARRAGATSATPKGGSTSTAGGEGASPTTRLIIPKARMDAPSFILRARLGNGTKPLSSTSLSSPIARKKRKYTAATNLVVETIADLDDANDAIPHLEDAGGANAIPESHLLSLVQGNSAVKILDVPPQVTDAQIADALREHCEVAEVGAAVTAVAGASGVVAGTTPGSLIMGLFGTPVVGVAGVVDGMTLENGDASLVSLSSSSISAVGISSGHGNSSTSSSATLYQRTVWAIMENETVRDKMLDNLSRSNSDSSRHQHEDYHHLQFISTCCFYIILKIRYHWAHETTMASTTTTHRSNRRIISIRRIVFH